MRKLFFVLTLSGLVSLVGACVTPMSPSQIDRLTTCKGTTLEKIRKNLLLAGYEITDQGKEDIVTDWKQVSGYGGNKTLTRLTVVKVDDDTFRFRVRSRAISVERENQGSVTTTTYDKKKKKSESVGIAFGRDVERSSDYDQSYYVEHESQYLQTQDEVCGRS